MQDSKNLVLAIVLCLAILFGWGRLAEYMGWVQKPDPAVVAYLLRPDYFTRQKYFC